jgi:hypothetical protein
MSVFFQEAKHTCRKIEEAAKKKPSVSKKKKKASRHQRGRCHSFLCEITGSDVGRRKLRRLEGGSLNHNHRQLKRKKGTIRHFRVADVSRSRGSSKKSTSRLTLAVNVLIGRHCDHLVDDLFTIVVEPVGVEWRGWQAASHF